MVPGLLARRPHGLHRRSLWRACAHRRARRSLLFWGDHRPLLDAGRDGLLDRAMRPFPVLQGIEARLLRLIERKVELCVAVEAVERSRVALSGNGASDVFSVSGLGPSVSLASAAATLVPSSGGVAVGAGEAGADAEVSVAAGAALFAGSTPTTRLVVPESSAADWGAAGSAVFVSASSRFWSAASCSCCDLRRAP